MIYVYKKAFILISHFLLFISIMKYSVILLPVQTQEQYNNASSLFLYACLKMIWKIDIINVVKCHTEPSHSNYGNYSS